MEEKILVVDDEESMRRMLTILLEEEGFPVEAVDSAESAIGALSKASYDLVLSDIRMPGLSGIDLLKWLREEELDSEVILLTAFASTDSAIDALKYGAFDYVTKPFQVDELLHIVRQALEKRSLRQENILLKADLSKKQSFGEIIGGNPKMRWIYNLIERIAPTPSTVLIEGESGTGKELVARAIHQRSLRNKRPFVTVNCAGLPETLLESELFGYIKGAFTGAYTTKKGLFDTASGGTIFLDEIGEMPLSMQVKLLRSLQEKRIHPLGASEDHSVDIRVIAATNSNLRERVNERTFRDDLYYRINVINIVVPPLRERKEDIPLLVHHFLQTYAEGMGRERMGISTEALRLLEEYGWPGNIRELENVIERAVAITPETILERGHLPDSVLGYRTRRTEDAVDIPSRGFDLNQAVEGFRRAYVQEALRLEGGVLKRAAKRLGITFRSMRYYVKKYHLEISKETDAP